MFIIFFDAVVAILALCCSLSYFILEGNIIIGIVWLINSILAAVCAYIEYREQ